MGGVEHSPAVVGSDWYELRRRLVLPTSLLTPLPHRVDHRSVRDGAACRTVTVPVTDGGTRRDRQTTEALGGLDSA